MTPNSTLESVTKLTRLIKKSQMQSDRLGGIHGAHTPLELLRELDLIEEDPRIMVLVIEAILNVPNTLHRSVHLLVPTEHNESCI